jgi:hypothetical protein
MAPPTSWLGNGDLAGRGDTDIELGLRLDSRGEVEGRTYTARSRHGPANELARQLVAARLVDRPLTEGARPWLGSLLLAYYDPEGRLVYAGR